MFQETRQCQSCKNQFTIEPDDFAFYETIKVPAPTWCPRCRLLRRLSWQGYRILYKRKCDFTGEMLISTHSPDSPHKVYRQDIWWSDKWDPMNYGREYDFSRSFFEQFRELFRAVPMPALHTDYSSMVNSEYCNGASNVKNGYLCFRISGGEDSAYLNMIVDLKNSFDVSFANYSELIYDSVNINKCYKVFYSQDCEESHDIWFSRDLVGCSDCIGCANLRNKSHYIFNRPYSKSEYEKFFAAFERGSLLALNNFKRKVQEFFLTQSRRAYHGIRNSDVSGDYIFNSKNVHDSYMVRNAEDLRYCQLLKAGPAAKSYDWTIFGDGAEWIYDSCWVGWDMSNVKFGSWDYGGHDHEYCFGCHGSSNLFGCVGIRKGEYCILNKQYGKSEYHDLVKKIKEQMMQIPYRDAIGREYRYGEFFPSELCPWPYNESSAYEWFPFSKDEVLAKGFSWRDPDVREYKDATVNVPDHIKDVTDDILKGILKCDNCGKNYQLIQKELQFYRRFSIPIPRECPLCRDRARIKLLNPMDIYNRKCQKCGKDIQTSYAPERPEIVYCEACYQQEVA